VSDLGVARRLRGMGATIERVSHRFFAESDPTKRRAKRLQRAAERERERLGWRGAWFHCVVVRAGRVEWGDYFGTRDPWFYGGATLPDFEGEGYLLLEISQWSAGAPADIAEKKREQFASALDLWELSERVRRVRRRLEQSRLIT